MNKKIVGYGLLSLCLMWVLFHLPFGSSKKALRSPPHEALASENETLVAPAIIDALNDITRIPTLQQGIIKHIYVKVGQKVNKGQALFSLDDTLAQNTVNIQKIVAEQAKNAVLIQTKQLEHAISQLERIKSLDKRAISQAELHEKIHEVSMGKMQLAQIQHNLALALANLDNEELALSQFTTVAPKDGIVLQINIHKNEFVGGAQQIILLGDAKKVIVRVSLDERDTQRFHSKASAYLTSNDNPELNIPLKFIQLDRYIVTLERLNSRVQEALYYFNRDDYPDLAAGQQFDANISVRTDA